MTNRYQPLIDQADEYLATLPAHLPEWHAAREQERAEPFIERVKETAREAGQLRDRLQAILVSAALPQTQENNADFLALLDEAKAYLDDQEDAIARGVEHLARVLSTVARLTMIRDLAAGLNMDEWSTSLSPEELVGVIKETEEKAS